MSQWTFNQWILFIIVGTLAYVIFIEMTGAFVAGLMGHLRPEAGDAIINDGGLIIGGLLGILTKTLLDEVRGK